MFRPRRVEASSFCPVGFPNWHERVTRSHPSSQWEPFLQLLCPSFHPGHDVCLWVEAAQRAGATRCCMEGTAPAERSGPTDCSWAKWLRATLNHFPWGKTVFLNRKHGISFRQMAEEEPSYQVGSSTGKDMDGRGWRGREGERHGSRWVQSPHQHSRRKAFSHLRIRNSVKREEFCRATIRNSATSDCLVMGKWYYLQKIWEGRLRLET